MQILIDCPNISSKTAGENPDQFYGCQPQGKINPCTFFMVIVSPFFCYSMQSRRKLFDKKAGLLQNLQQPLDIDKQ
ncbi:MAG: hypothetical protein ACLR1Q_11770 [Ruminococcus sp.]